METTIPFCGFYNSIHDDNIDNAIDSHIRNDEDYADAEKLEKFRNAQNFQKIYLEYAKKYAQEFAHELGIQLEFKLLSSPKFYNYSTDRIFCEIPLQEVVRLYLETDNLVLENLIKEKFTSCSGFVSHYSNELEKWPKDFSKWDHNQIGTLIEAYSDGEFVEHELVNDENGFISNLFEYPED